MQLLLSISGAALLFVTAVYHLTGLQQISEGLVGERRGLARAAWVVVAIDWFVIGVIWIAVALQYLPQAVTMSTASIPLIGAIVLAATMGLGFPGVWLLGLAGAIGSASGLI